MRGGRGGTSRTLALWGLAGVVAALPPARLAAQVGHDPARSPYRDITTRQMLSGWAGWFGGNRAVTGVGARSAAAAGARFDTKLSGPADLSASVAWVWSSRNVVDSLSDSLPPPAVFTGAPIAVPLLLADLGFTFNLTGAKSWRGLAPFAGLAIGVVSPRGATADTSGFRPTTQFAIVPSLGVRAFLSRALALRLELRDHYFRYDWPHDLATAAGVNRTQWTHNLLVAVGAGYAFTF